MEQNISRANDLRLLLIGDEQFGALIAALLKRYGDKLADALGVSRPTVKRWAGGKNLPHPFMRRPIILALGLDHDAPPPRGFLDCGAMRKSQMCLLDAGHQGPHESVTKLWWDK